MTTQTKFADGVLTVTRVYDAPREAVFDAWIAVAKFEQWYGPAQCTGVRATIEPKLGGAFNTVMQMGPDREFEVPATITAFEPPALLAFAGPGPGPDTKSTIRVEFKDLGGKTEVRLTQDNLPEGAEKGVVPAWTAAFDKLEAFLAKESAAT